SRTIWIIRITTMSDTVLHTLLLGEVILIGVQRTNSPTVVKVMHRLTIEVCFLHRRDNLAISNGAYLVILEDVFWLHQLLSTCQRKLYSYRPGSRLGIGLPPTGLRAGLTPLTSRAPDPNPCSPLRLPYRSASAARFSDPGPPPPIL